MGDALVEDQPREPGAAAAACQPGQPDAFDLMRQVRREARVPQRLPVTVFPQPPRAGLMAIQGHGHAAMHFRTAVEHQRFAKAVTGVGAVDQAHLRLAAGLRIPGRHHVVAVALR